MLRWGLPGSKFLLVDSVAAPSNEMAKPPCCLAMSRTPARTAISGCWGAAMDFPAAMDLKMGPLAADLSNWPLPARGRSPDDRPVIAYKLSQMQTRTGQDRHDRVEHHPAHNRKGKRNPRNPRTGISK